MADTAGVQRGPGDRSQEQRADAGFTLVEQVVAMMIIVIVMLGLLSTIGATATGINAGRQRTIAVSLARKKIESLRTANYADVMTGSGVTADQKVGTTTPSKFEGGGVICPDLTSPSPYRETVSTADAASTTFSLRVFVTAVTNCDTDAFRQITVIIEWPYVSLTVTPPHLMRFSTLVAKT